jgi:hypothetical protein
LVAVVNVGIGLDNPYEFFAWVVEVEFNSVAGGTNGFGTSELKLFDEVFMGVLGHASAFIGVKEDVVNVERSGYKRLFVGICYFNFICGVSAATEFFDGE